MNTSPASADIARCFCGQVELQLLGQPKSVINCHCGQCRSFSGSAFTTWASYRTDNVRISNATDLSQIDTPNGLRYFCKRCGTYVFSEDRRYKSIYGIPAGVIKGFTLTPQAHYFVDHKAVWHSINDDLPQFGGESGFEPITQPVRT